MQMNPNVFLYNTAFSVQLCYIAGLLFKLMYLLAIINYIFIGHEARARTSICSQRIYEKVPFSHSSTYFLVTVSFYSLIIQIQAFFPRTPALHAQLPPSAHRYGVYLVNLIKN